MSTKIYYGWKVDNITLEKLLPRLKRFQKAVYEKATDLTCKHIMRKVVFCIDRSAMQGTRITWHNPGDHDWTYKNSSILSLMAHEVDDAIQEAFESPTKKLMDLGCSMTCHPIKGDVLIILFDQTDGEYESLFKKIVKAKPFPYWDNSDQPDGMTWAQWKARGRLWDKALGDDGIPAHGGYAYDCITKENRPLSFTIRYYIDGGWEALVASFEDRVKKIAEDYVFEQKMRSIAKKEPTAKFGDHYYDVRDWMKSKAGQDALARAAKRAEKRLKETLTKDDLARPAKDILRPISKKKAK